MAAPNIEERQQFVKELMNNNTPDKIIKKAASSKFDCHTSAIGADLIYLRNLSNPDKTTYHLSKKTRNLIYGRDGKNCQYCGISDADIKYIIEHIVPAAIGGKAIPENLVVSCHKCNTTKRRKIWIPKNFIEITQNNLEHRDYVINNAVIDFR
jgi:hypothetical protein